ncbi:MAG: 4Fe-4S dicluster domain-containing protein [bacterium]|nr:4Fe-4S dicluster domain-containing protein [bacterium]
MHLTVIPERCSGCKVCELACSVGRAGANNPKKSRIRVMVLYPHPVIRMPIVCKQCGVPKCGEGCPTNAIYRENGVVQIDEEKCISCYQCIASCPFGAMFLHEEVEQPLKCDLCDGQPMCVQACPKEALKFHPKHILGQAHRLSAARNYAKMSKVEYMDGGEKKTLRYARIKKGGQDET